MSVKNRHVRHHELDLFLDHSVTQALSHRVGVKSDEIIITVSQTDPETGEPVHRSGVSKKAEAVEHANILATESNRATLVEMVEYALEPDYLAECDREDRVPVVYLIDFECGKTAAGVASVPSGGDA